jgi:hypothetical protein
MAIQEFLMKSKSVSENLCSRTIIWFCAVAFFFCALPRLSFAQTPFSPRHPGPNEMLVGELSITSKIP